MEERKAGRRGRWECESEKGMKDEGLTMPLSADQQL